MVARRTGYRLFMSGDGCPNNEIARRPLRFATRARTLRQSERRTETSLKFESTSDPEAFQSRPLALLPPLLQFQLDTKHSLH
jgi:hypothetical protein